MPTTDLATPATRRDVPPAAWLAPSWPWVSLAVRLLLAGFFGAAGALKLPDPAESVRAVRAYQVLPEVLAKAVGYGLPVLEIALALLLLAGIATRTAAVGVGVLLVVFITGITQAWARGLTIDCGCFGGGGTVAANQTSYGTEILRDVGLLIAALALATWPLSRFALDRRPSPTPTRTTAKGTR